LLMQHGFEPMTVEVTNERRIVAWVVVLANAGSPFVCSTCIEGGRVKAIDGFTCRCNKGDMKSVARAPRFVTREDGERGLAFEARRTVADRARLSPQARVTKRSQTGIVKGSSAIEILDANGDVIEHVTSLAQRGLCCLMR
jgi:hypothetical protein